MSPSNVPVCAPAALPVTSPTTGPVCVPAVSPVILPVTLPSNVAATSVSIPNVHLSVASSHTNVLLASVPRSTSIPDVPNVTPAAVSPLFNTITLSVIAVLVVSISVVSPVIVKSPAITTSLKFDVPAVASTLPFTSFHAPFWYIITLLVVEL